MSRSGSGRPNLPANPCEVHTCGSPGGGDLGVLYPAEVPNQPRDGISVAGGPPGQARVVEPFERAPTISRIRPKASSNSSLDFIGSPLHLAVGGDGQDQTGAASGQEHLRVSGPPGPLVRLSASHAPNTASALAQVVLCRFRPADRVLIPGTISHHDVGRAPEVLGSGH